MKADESTESRYLHEIYNDSPFCLAARTARRGASLPPGDFISRKVVGTSICFTEIPSPLVTVHAGTPRDADGAGTKIHGLAIKQFHEKCQSSARETGPVQRAIVLESISICTSHRCERTLLLANEFEKPVGNLAPPPLLASPAPPGNLVASTNFQLLSNKFPRIFPRDRGLRFGGAGEE